MRSLSRFFLLGFLALSVGSSSSAQQTPHEAVAAMGRGINLGNTLEPPREGAWNNGPAQERYFDAYVDAGFQTVRIPVRWDEHTADVPPYAVQASWMDRVEQVVDWGLDRGLYVILNAHHEDWLKQNYADSAIRARFDSIWVQVAERFQNKPDRLLMEIINEPFGMTRDQVDDLNARVLGIIRETNPTRNVIYSGNEYSNIPQLLAAAVPDDDHVIGYFHSYDPWSFAGMAQGTWGTAAQRAQVGQRFGQVAAWSESVGVPVILSEFGAIRPADDVSRMVFYSTYVEEALRHGFAFQVWDDGGDFRVLNRPADQWGEELTPLIYAFPDGPTDLRAVDAGPVSLAWQLRTRSDSMFVQRRLNNTYETVGALAGFTTTFVDSTAIGGLTYRYRVIARATGQTDKYSYPIEVRVRPSSRAPYSGEPFAVPGLIEAEDFDEGGEGLTYHDTTPGNASGAYRANVSVDLAARGDGGVHITDIAAGEWQEYTLAVPEAGEYVVTAYVGAVTGRASFRISIGDRTSDLLRVPTTGDEETFMPVAATLTLAPGEQVLRVDHSVSTRPYTLDRIEVTAMVTPGSEAPANADIGLQVYPNPVRDELTVVAKGGDGSRVVEIFDALGKRVHRVALPTGSEQRIDVADLASGTYWVRLLTSDGILARSRFVKP